MRLASASSRLHSRTLTGTDEFAFAVAQTVDVSAFEHLRRRDGARTPRARRRANTGVNLGQTNTTTTGIVATQSQQGRTVPFGRVYTPKPCGLPLSQPGVRERQATKQRDDAVAWLGEDERQKQTSITIDRQTNRLCRHRRWQRFSRRLQSSAAAAAAESKSSSQIETLSFFVPFKVSQLFDVADDVVVVVRRCRQHAVARRVAWRVDARQLRVRRRHRRRSRAHRAVDGVGVG